MAYDSRDVSDLFGSRAGRQFDWIDADSAGSDAGSLPMGALSVSFETLERLSTFASRTHTLDCCPCGEDHSNGLLAHKLSLAGLSATGNVQSGGPQFAPDGSPQSQIFNLSGEVAGSTATAVTIAVGDIVNSQVEISLDQDWFRINLQAGVTYEFRLNGSGVTPLADPYLEIMSASGTQLKFNDDGDGLNSVLQFTPDASGTFYLNAHGWVDENGTPTNTTDDFSGTGGYTLTAIQAPTLPTYTIDEIANYLVNEGSSNGRSWGPDSLTYNIEALTSAQQALAERALQAWSAVTPLVFTRVTSGGNITFTNVDPTPNPDPANPGSFLPQAYAQNTYSGNAITASTIVITSDWNSGNTGFDSYTQQTYIHEVGHALGLGHGGPYNGSADYGTDNIYTNDHWAYTVMSYFDQLEAGHGSYRFVLGLQQADIAAIQQLYGSRPGGTFAGNTTFGFNSSAPGTNIDWSQYVFVDGTGTYRRPPAMTIYDTSGVDTINLSGFSQPQILNLNGGTFSTLGDRPIANQPNYSNVVAIGLSTFIENAVGGSGNDTITGNGVNNVITLGAGSDIFVYTFGGGADTITDFSLAQDRIDLSSFSEADALAAFNSRTSVSGGTLLNFFVGTYTILLQGVTPSQLTLSNLILSASPPPPPPPPPPTGVSLVGTAAGDVLYGTAGDDQLQGLGGVDTLYGLEGVDAVYGGAGDDTLSGGGGNDVLYGEADNDVLYGGDGSDTLLGADGNDTLNGDAGIDLLIGGAGADIVLGGAADDILHGNEGDDRLYGDDGHDQTYGGLGADTIYGGLGNDAIYGEDGDDVVYAAGGSDMVIGGAGVDVLYGEADDDAIYGGLANDTLIGGNGADTLYGESGVDGLYGGMGGDTLIGGDDTDVLYGETDNDVLYGGNANDTLLGADGDDTLYGEAGVDLLLGGFGADVILGGGDGDVLYGEDGDDRLYGEDGNDQFFGGFGSDTLYGGLGDDAVYGEAGNDVVYAGDGTDMIIGGDGVDVLYGEAGNDVIYAGDSIDTLLGGEGVDTLYGEVGNDALYGGNGNDTLSGGIDHDSLYGEAGDDTLYGGDGNDGLKGGDGNDFYLGGFGTDTFILDNGASGTLDRVFDFAQGSDVLRLVASGFSSFAEIQAAMTTLSGIHTLITMASGAQIRIDNLLPGQFTSADFVLAASAEPQPESNPKLLGELPGTDVEVNVASRDPEAFTFASLAPDRFDFSGFAASSFEDDFTALEYRYAPVTHDPEVARDAFAGPVILQDAGAVFDFSQLAQDDWIGA